MHTLAGPAVGEMLVGAVERVTFHNAETGFCVLRVQVRGRRDLTTVVGRAAVITPGERIQATGQWVNDRSHGLQFQASFLQSAPPASAEGIEKYLSSGLIRGIGPIYARKLIAAFGDAVFEVIETEPERLRKLPGIGPQRARQIIEGWAEQRAVREIMIFLHEHQISTARSVRIYRLYGSDAIRLISENPYRLARDVRGIGFLSADRIAAAFGIARDSLLRIRAGLSHVLSEAMAEGHCGLPRAELIEASARVLEVETGLVEQGHRRGGGGRHAGRGHDRRPAGGVPGLAVPLRAQHRRAAERPQRRPAALVRDRCRPGAALGRGAGRHLAGAEPGGRPAPGAARQGAGHHRRPRRRQDDAGQQHHPDPRRQGHPHPAGGTHRPGGQADERGNRAGGPDPAPAARGRSPHRRLQAVGGEPAGGRPAGGGRNLDGRCPADVRAAQGRAARHGAAAGRRRGPAAQRRARDGCWATSSTAASCRWSG